MSNVNKIKLPDNTVVDINDSRINITQSLILRMYRNATGTAGSTSSPYKSTKWDVTDETITDYIDGMVVCLEVPVAGTGTYGDVFQINSLGYKPVVFNINTTISTRYGVGSIIWMTYNSTQTATWYNNSSSATTVTGCWQIMDYDANTTSIYTLMYYRGTRICAADVRRYILCVFPDETTILPLNSTASTGNAGSTATTKTMTTGTFDPLKGIVYYTTNAIVTSGNTIAMSTMYRQYASVDLRYSFNCGTTSFTANSEVYMVMDLQSDGRLCKLASTPYSDTLPSTNDGHLYMLLGFAYSKYQIELYPMHPIYYHDGTSLKEWGNFSGNYNDLSNKPTIPTVPTNVSAFNNDAGYLTQHQSLSGYATTQDLEDAIDETKVFWAEVDVTTIAEIKDAVDAGRTVMLKDENGYTYVLSYIGSYATFSCSSGEGNFIRTYDVYEDDSWELLPLYDIETTRNLVQSVSSSSSQSEYPSAAAVYQALQSYTPTSQLASVATSGSYNDLSNKPTIPDAVSGTNDGTNWTSLTIGSTTKAIPSGGGGGGLSDYDFTHTANQSVSGSVTVTYAANTRGSKMVSASADLSVTFAVNNSSDNYLWVKNTGSSDIDILISSVTYNSSSVSNVYMPADGITIPAGKVCEIGIVCNADGAFITSRSDLSL